MDLYLKKHLIYNDKINKDFTIFTLSDLHIDKNFNFEILKSLTKEDKCMIIASHNPLIKKYADVSLKLKNGCLYEEK